MRAGFDDAARVKALRDYEVLDTPPDILFDSITTFAASLFGVPISLVSLVDADRQWFKSKVGLSAEETSRNVSFCTHAVEDDGPLVVSDATADPRFANNPLVLADPNIRFYAGVPLRSPEGHGLGTLCIVDSQPRSLDADQLAQLDALAKLATSALELHRKEAILQQQFDAMEHRQKTKEMLASMVVHDLRGPLTAILALAMSNADQSDLLRDILASARRMQRMLLDVLDICLADVECLKARTVTTDLSELVRGIRTQLHEPLYRDRLELELPPEPAVGQLDPDLMERVLSNLIENAFRYSPAKSPVKVRVSASSTGLEVDVVSQGEPLSAGEAAKVFSPLARGEVGRGHGLGLAFCKLAADAHGGSIRVEPGSPSGNRFVLALPVGNIA
ncbi:MAG: GAF domain-containing protein [Myxococcales bacterium]|nr:GAF domain-containing protein [Myxococcales bacterium]MCB9581288.1 GAF domain-containing protein [Polyangiaceae bacterium]